MQALVCMSFSTIFPYPYFPQCFIHIHNTFPSPPPPCLTSPSLPPPCLTSPSLPPPCLTSPSLPPPCLASPSLPSPCLISLNLPPPCLTSPSLPSPCLTSPSLPPPCLTSPSLLPLCLTPSPPSPYLTFPIPWCPLLYWMINTIESLFILTTFTIVIHLQTFFTWYNLFTSMTLHFTLVAIGFTISSTHWSIYISTDKLTIACNINTSGRLWRAPICLLEKSQTFHHRIP